MSLTRISIHLSAVLLLVASTSVGCNQTQTSNLISSSTETTLVGNATGDCCSSEKGGECAECAAAAALANNNSEDCGDCPVCAGKEASQTVQCQCEANASENAKLTDSKTQIQGCCGKCAEELRELAAKKTGGCGDCSACASGNSANCKCSDDPQSTEPKPGESNELDGDQADNVSATSNFVQDRDVFHFLLSNKDKIQRERKETKNGVETLTESSDPAIVEKIQEHVASMYQRVENIQPIRMRDPLYREIFKNTDKIEMKLEKTEHGIRVTETSDDEYVVKLIQEHAKVVSGFVDHGFEEAQKNHEPPAK